MHLPKIVHIYGSDLTNSNEPATLCEFEKKTGSCECCSSCTDVEIQYKKILVKKIEVTLSLPSTFLTDAELVATSNKPLKQLKTNKYIDYFPNLTVLRI